MLALAVLYAVFGWAAAEDLTKREIPDWLAIVAWAMSAFLFELQFFLLAFVGVWAFAEFIEWKWHSKLFGWGDILWIPVFASLVSVISGIPDAILLIFISMLIGQLFMWYQINYMKLSKKKIRGSPYVLVMFLTLVVLFISKAFF